MARKKVDTRQLECAVCGYKHYAKDSGWVALASNKTICYSLEGRNCYGKMQMLRSDKARPPKEDEGTLDILKEFESW